MEHVDPNRERFIVTVNLKLVEAATRIARIPNLNRVPQCLSRGVDSAYLSPFTLHSRSVGPHRRGDILPPSFGGRSVHLIFL